MLNQLAFVFSTDSPMLYRAGRDASGGQQKARLIRAGEGGRMLDDRGPFLGAAKAHTMLRDFDRLRRAIREHDSFESEAAWDRCERWVDQLRPVTGRASPV